MKKLIYSVLLTVFIVAGIYTAGAQPTAAKTAYYCPLCRGDCDTIAFAAPGKCPHCGMELVLENKADRIKELTTIPIRVLFYLQDGVEVLDFAGPMEVFVDAGFDVAVVSKTKDVIKSQGVLKIIPDFTINDAPRADILAFFGGNAGVAANDPAVIKWVKNQPAPQFYFSVCTGAFILGKAGFLDHLTVTTFHESIEGLRQAVPSAKVLANVRFVDNGKIMTTAGISAGIDGALHLVAKIRGDEAAVAVAKFMEYDKWVPGQGLVIGNKTVKP